MEIPSERLAWWIWTGGLLCVTIWISQLPQPVPLFGDLRSLVTHMIAVLPASWFVAHAIRSDRPGSMWTSLGAALGTWLIVSLLGVVSTFLLEANVGFGVRLTTRILLASSIATLWILGLPVQRFGLTAGATLTAVVLAVSIPWIDSVHRIEVSKGEISVYQASRRIESLYLKLLELLELEPSAVVDGKPVTSLFLSVAKEREQLGTWLQTTKPDFGDSQALLDRCTALMALGRDREAIELLESLPESNSTGQLLRALIARNAGNWRELQNRCESALAKGSNPTDDARCTWFELLGESLARQGQHTHAADCYRRGMTECGFKAPLFELQLGIQLGELGRFQEANDHLRHAASTEPTLRDEVDRQSRRFNNQRCMPR